MNFLDVAIDAPFVRSEFVWASGDQTFGLDLGVAAALGAWRVPKADLVLLTGVHVSTRSYGEDFGITSWEVPVEGGWRWASPSQTALVRPYWELGGGPHLLLLTVSRTAPLLDAALGTHTGLGLTIGRGDVRAVLGVRGGVRLGFDQISGSITRPSGTYSWTWTALNARMDGYAGVSFR